MTATGELRHRQVDGAELRGCMRLLPTGVSLLTAGEGDEVIGMTVNSVVSVSLEPPVLLVSVHRRARITARLPKGMAFTVGFLGADQTALAKRFASASRPVGAAAVAAMAGRPGYTGVPAPSGSPGVVECVVRQAIPVGDHVLVLGLVVHAEVRADARAPQVFYRGELITVAGDLPERKGS